MTAIKLDTSLIRYLPPIKPEEHDLYVAFSCPVFKRVGNLKSTRVLEDRHPGKTWGGYFNYKNRADIAIPWYSYFFFTLISILLGSLSLLPIGFLSKLEKGSSTHEQRVWIVCWVLFGFVIGTFAGFWTSVLDLKTYDGVGLGKWVKFLGKLLFAVFFAAPGIGGFVMVGQMLRQYGNCVSLF